MKTVHTLETLRAKILQEATFTVEIEQEHEDVRGNYIVSGDDEYDEAEEEKILNRLEDGDIWAWCIVKVVGTWHELDAFDCLGGCSYDNESQFIEPGGYYDDMKYEVANQIAAQALKVHQAISDDE